MVLDEAFHFEGQDATARYKSFCVFSKVAGRWLWAGRPDDGHARIKSGSKWRLIRVLPTVRSGTRFTVGLGEKVEAVEQRGNDCFGQVQVGHDGWRRGEPRQFTLTPKSIVTSISGSDRHRKRTCSFDGRLGRSAAIRSAIAGNEVSILELAASASARTLYPSL